MNDKPSQIDSLAYDELRQLLLGPELQKLKKLTDKLENKEQFSSEISEVLPEAMQKSAKQGDQLSKAMVPTVEQIVRLSIKRDINKFADALFPVIGPAIRKSIAETITEMLQSLNQVLEHGLSWQGVKWRIESLRTGIPFAQIVLLNSLDFHVDQVFLIHRNTGLLLKHVERGNTFHQDADMVSSMLAAIQDFVGDSFEIKDRQELDSIQVGDFSIYIEKGPEALLALAFHGNSPGNLRTIMQQTLEQTQSIYHAELEIFKGDTAPFEPCTELLSTCLIHSHKKASDKKISLRSKLVWVTFFILLGYWVIAKVYLSIQQQDYVDALQKEPGYIITQIEYDNGQLNIKGLKDPLARDAEKFMALVTLNPDDVLTQFAPYYSLNKLFVEQRLITILNPPANTSITLQAGVAVLKGYASEDKITAMNIMAPLIAGIDQVDSHNLSSRIDLSSLSPPESIQLSLDINKGLLISSGLANSEWVEFAREQVHHISGIIRYDDSAVKTHVNLSVFNPPDTIALKIKGKTLVIKGKADSLWINTTQALAQNYDQINNINLSQFHNSDEDDLLSHIEQLEKISLFFNIAEFNKIDDMKSVELSAQLVAKIINLSKTLSTSATIVIQGYADTVGSFKDNSALSLARSNYIAQYLIGTGINPNNIQIKGILKKSDKEKNKEEERYNRRVSFSVKHQ